MNITEIDSLAKIIWDYHCLSHNLSKSDCILALGSNDTRVADKAIDLYFEGYAPIIIFSGGLGKLTKDRFNKPEAEIFADIAYKRDVPKEKVLIENKSTNSGENILFTEKLIKEKELILNSFIIVQKPYMERRTYATAKKLWPEKEFKVTSPKISYENYFTNDLPRNLVINTMVGDLQRIEEYPKKGFQIHQEIPAEVWDAYKKLVNAGFTKHLIQE